MRRLLGLAVLLGVGLCAASPAEALPILQLYLEGASYDHVTDTWVLAAPGSSAGRPFRLWAIGNIQAPGGKGVIEDVRLSVAFKADQLGMDISFTPTAVDTGRFPGFVDPSVPPQPLLSNPVRTSNTAGQYQYFAGGLVDDGGRPVLGDGSNLPAHGIFGPDTVWYEYSLGDFSTADSPVGDFIGAVPAVLYPQAGQINVYEITAVGYSGATLHFDLYNTVIARNHSLFAPFSHDADAESNIVAEPHSVLLWLLIGLTWAGSAWVYQYWSRWRQWEEQLTAVAGCRRPLELAGQEAERRQRAISRSYAAEKRQPAD